MKQDNPFARLGALDQKLYQETTPPEREARNKISGNPEIQKPRNPVVQQSGNPENSSHFPETQNSGNPEIQNSPKRELCTKGTYRLCDAALDAIGDAKKILRRQYGVKFNLEEIVETAILEAYKDLIQNKRDSRLVCEYSGNPETQKS